MRIKWEKGNKDGNKKNELIIKMEKSQTSQTLKMVDVLQEKSERRKGYFYWRVINPRLGS